MPVQPDQTIDPQTGLPPNVTAPNLAPPPAPPAPAQQPGGTQMDYLVSQGLVDPGRETEFYRLNAQRGQVEQQAAGNINARLGMADRAITAPVAMPAQPKLQDVPKPPQYQYRDAMQTFQSPAVLLATLGSLFTRRPAVNALTAGAAAITGFMEGDKEKVEREEKNWKNAVEATIWQNQKEINEFNAAATGTRLNIADRDARLSAIFSANRDEIGLAALRTGSQERLQQFQKMKIKAQDALVNSLEKYNAQYGQGIMSDDAIDSLVGVYMKTGKVPPRLFSGPVGQQNAARFTERLSQVGTPEQIVKAQQQTQAAQKTINAFATGPEGRSTRSLSVALSHLDVLEGLIKELHNTSSPAFNRYVQLWKQQTGQDAPTNFDAARQIVGQEVVKSIVPGAGGVTERLAAAESISRTASPKQLEGVISTTKSLMKGQLEGLRRQYESNTNLTDFDKYLSGEAKTQLEGGGGATTKRPRATNPNTGASVEWDGKSWVPVQ